jgi:hypothetical protein
MHPSANGISVGVLTEERALATYLVFGDLWLQDPSGAISCVDDL